MIARIKISAPRSLSKKNKPLEFDVKKTDKSLCQVGDSLYAYAFEVSNADYTLFINNLNF